MNTENNLIERRSFLSWPTQSWFDNLFYDWSVDPAIVDAEGVRDVISRFNDPPPRLVELLTESGLAYSVPYPTIRGGYVDESVKNTCDAMLELIDRPARWTYVFGDIPTFMFSDASHAVVFKMLLA